MRTMLLRDDDGDREHAGHQREEQEEERMPVDRRRQTLITPTLTSSTMADRSCLRTDRATLATGCLAACDY